MVDIADYAERYDCLKMDREDGVLTVTSHTDGGPFQWGFAPHEELPRAFADMGADRENRVIVFTGTGPTFSAPQISPTNVHFPAEPPTANQWDVALWEGKHLVSNLLDIEVPIISAVNGPCYRHSELVLLNDIVLCTDDASFEDSAHFAGGGLVPGDGVHVMYPLLLGINRARYFMLTGQQLDATKALELGLVGEVLPRDQLMARAMELAHQLAAKPLLQLRYTRVLMTQVLKRQMLDLMGYGLALEGLALMGKPR
jgi:enoyl-CoA hydratase/carnithine racemase